ncbi:MAG TPA: hypothetical protein VGZ22_21335 [Isosphaeraceae bacterium]|jgi:uncharacterized protein YpmB|nr:hypothetical protein [Isosphaeraceae bacterium]
MPRANLHVLLCTSLAILAIATVQGQEYTPDENTEKVELTAVPPAVRKTADEKARGVDFKQAYKDQTESYRLAGKDSDGRLVIVQTDKDGKLVSVTTKTKAEAKKLPKAVTSALKAAVRKGGTLRGFRAKTADKAETTLAGQDEPKLVYEFDGQNAENVHIRASFFESGKVDRVDTVAKSSEEDQKDLSLAKLPMAVQRAAKEAAPNVKFTKAVEDKTNAGLNTYLLTGKDPQGREVTLDVTPQGTVNSMRMDVSAQDIPQAAVLALQNQMQQNPALAGFKPQKYQQLELRQLQGGGAVYALLGKNLKGDALEVRIGPDPSMVNVMPAQPKDLGEAKDQRKDQRKAR